MFRSARSFHRPMADPCSAQDQSSKSRRHVQRQKNNLFELTFLITGRKRAPEFLDNVVDTLHKDYKEKEKKVILSPT